MLQGNRPRNCDDEAMSRVESEDNRIYFYADVTPDTILSLEKELRKKDYEHMSEMYRKNLMEPNPICVHIYSYGGYTYAGLLGMDIINTIDTPVYTFVDGAVASAATFIALAPEKVDNRYISRHGHMLIHQLSNSLPFSKYEEIKDLEYNSTKSMETIREIYLEKTRLSENELDDVLKRDIYFTAEECIKHEMVGNYADDFHFRRYV